MELAEIIARMNQIDLEVRNCTDAAKIAELTEELKGLKAKRAQLEAAEARREEAEGIARGTVDTVMVATGGAVERSYDAGSPEYRSAWLKRIAVNRDGEPMFGEMTAEERAAFTFTTANTGSVVPTAIMNKIIDRVKSMSPILDDAEW